MSKRADPEDINQRIKRQRLEDLNTDHNANRNAVDRSTQALCNIAEKADELIYLLQAVKKQSLQGQTTRELHVKQTGIQLVEIFGYLSPSIQALTHLEGIIPRTNERVDAGEKASDVSGNGALLPYGVPLPSAIAVTPWLSSEIRQELPNLPKILDPDLAEETFTHPGLGRRFNYERLEWLGDAYLELIATALIHQTFGRLPSGRCSQLRERLIRNVNLAEYFRHYGMQRWAKLPSDFSDGRGLGRGRSSDKDLLKTQADMFEAYVAAVILSDPQNGLSTVVEWLKNLWGKTIEDDIRKAEATKRTFEPSAPPPSAATATATATATTSTTTNSTKLATESSAKERLSQKIVVPGVKISYKDLPCDKRDKDLRLQLFSIGVYLDGWGEKDRLLAVGTSLSKKEAGQKAADTVLQNKKLMKVYEEKKRAYLQARQGRGGA